MLRVKGSRNGRGVDIRAVAPLTVNELSVSFAPSGPHNVFLRCNTSNEESEESAVRLAPPNINSCDELDLYGRLRLPMSHSRAPLIYNPCRRRYIRLALRKQSVLLRQCSCEVSKRHFVVCFLSPKSSGSRYNNREVAACTNGLLILAQPPQVPAQLCHLPVSWDSVLCTLFTRRTGQGTRLAM